MAKVCISSCIGALDWSASLLEGLSRLLSLPRRAETSVCTHVCVGFPTVSSGSCDTGQRALHCALHRALMLVRVALAPLALLPDPFLSIALHKHLKLVHLPLEAESPRAEHPADKAKELLLLAPSLQQVEKSSPDQQHGPGMRDGACLPSHDPASPARRMRSEPWLPPAVEEIKPWAPTCWMNSLMLS